MNKIKSLLYIKWNCYNNKIQNFKYWNILIILLWIFLYSIGLLKLIRIKYFIIIILMIGVYKIMWKIVENKKDLKIKEKWLYKLLKLSEKNNLILLLISYIEIKEWKNNLIIKSIIKINILIPLKILLFYCYIIIYKFRKLTLYEIMWKRAYGLILSIVIFTNIIEILIITFGGRINVYILIYIIIWTLSYIYKSEIKDYKIFYLAKKDNPIFYLYNLHLIQIWEQRINSNMLCFYIKREWYKKPAIEKLKFLALYGKNIKVEWLQVLEIDSIDVFEYELKSKKYNLNYIDENITNISLIINNILEYESELEYLKLLYKNLDCNKKFNENIKILKEHNIQELLEYNKIMLKSLLYLIWDINANIELEVDKELGLKIEEDYDIKLKNFKIIKEFTLFEHRKLYEINLFTKFYNNDFEKFPIIYIKNSEQYDKYIKYWKWENTTIKFLDKETQEVINSKENSWDIRVNSFTNKLKEINKEWEQNLEHKIQEYKKEYKKGLYVEYFKKL